MSDYYEESFQFEEVFGTRFYLPENSECRFQVKSIPVFVQHDLLQMDLDEFTTNLGVMLCVPTFTVMEHQLDSLIEQVVKQGRKKFANTKFHVNIPIINCDVDSNEDFVIEMGLFIAREPFVFNGKTHAARH